MPALHPPPPLFAQKIKFIIINQVWIRGYQFDSVLVWVGGDTYWRARSSAWPYRAAVCPQGGHPCRRARVWRCRTETSPASSRYVWNQKKATTQINTQGKRNRKLRSGKRTHLKEGQLYAFIISYKTKLSIFVCTLMHEIVIDYYACTQITKTNRNFVWK